MNLDAFTLLKILYHGDNKKGTKRLIFFIFISTNSNELPSTTSTMSKLAVSFIDNAHLTIIILKGKILVLGKEPCFDYWAILSLQYFLPVLHPANDFPCYFNVLEITDIHTKLF